MIKSNDIKDKLKKIKDFLCLNKKKSNSIKLLYKCPSKIHGEISIIRNSSKKTIELLCNGKRSSASYFRKNFFPFARLYHYYFLLPLYKNRFNKLLFIGGGGFCLPSYVSKNFKDKKVITIEIDSLLHDLAKKYLNAEKVNRNFLVFNQEGLNFLKKDSQKYDSIFVDIGWRKDYKIGKLEAEEHIKKTLKQTNQRLKKNGFILANFMLILSKEHISWFEKIVIKDLKNKYQTVLVFADNPQDYKNLQDVTIIASDSIRNPDNLLKQAKNNYKFIKKNWPFVEESFTHLIDLSTIK